MAVKSLTPSARQTISLWLARLGRVRRLELAGWLAVLGMARRAEDQREPIEKPWVGEPTEDLQPRRSGRSVRNTRNQPADGP